MFGTFFQFDFEIHVTKLEQGKLCDSATLLKVIYLCSKVSVFTSKGLEVMRPGQNEEKYDKGNMSLNKAET